MISVMINAATRREAAAMAAFPAPMKNRSPLLIVVDCVRGVDCWCVVSALIRWPDCMVLVVVRCAMLSACAVTSMPPPCLFLASILMLPLSASATSPVLLFIRSSRRLSVSVRVAVLLPAGT